MNILIQILVSCIGVFVQKFNIAVKTLNLYFPLKKIVFFVKFSRTFFSVTYQHTYNWYTKYSDYLNDLYLYFHLRRGTRSVLLVLFTMLKRTKVLPGYQVSR